VLAAVHNRRQFLVVDDYGTGGIWFVLNAASEDQIHAELRNVKVFAPGTKPDWMTEAFLRDVADRRTFDIDELPASDWMNRLRLKAD
jgi:hypothetical protein